MGSIHTPDNRRIMQELTGLLELYDQLLEDAEDEDTVDQNLVNEVSTLKSGVENEIKALGNVTIGGKTKRKQKKGKTRKRNTRNTMKQNISAIKKKRKGKSAKKTKGRR